MTTYHVLIYHTVDGYVERRKPYRSDHLRLVELASERDEIVMAGALDEPADSALLVFRGDRSIAENFAKQDPYVQNGLIESWEVRPWRVVIDPTNPTPKK